MAEAACAWHGRHVKALLFLLMLTGLLAAAFVLPRGKPLLTPQVALRATAHGLRAGWDWIASLGHEEKQTPEKPAHSAPPRRKAMARTSREGIIPQPPKEKLAGRDRAALDALIKSR